jgi:hypothetical protein
MGLPVTALRSNTWKVEAMMADVGLGGRTVDPGADSPWPRAPYDAEERRLIEAYKSQVRAAMTAMFSAMLS